MKYYNSTASYFYVYYLYLFYINYFIVFFIYLDLNNIQQITNEKPSNVPWKQLIHFNDTSAFYKIESICKLIGLYGDCNFIGRYLMDLFESKILYRREITLLINIILSESMYLTYYNNYIL